MGGACTRLSSLYPLVSSHRPFTHLLQPVNLCADPSPSVEVCVCDIKRGEVDQEGNKVC